ncbi:hypothetical protein Taro_005955 [Colocasia esculenta]|uniref:Protein EARLY HEADING DATE 2 n=1 Tax=Colocasia esculenta TaxID=4460 RepID=A0A843TTZ7_COLES|nr:hypothetical protein [Colocasia esculenta]
MSVVASWGTCSNGRAKRKILKSRACRLNIWADPDAEVIALSPRSLLATNRYVCEVCHKGFQRDQNLQLHRRGHNLPWKLKQRSGTEVRKRVYVCPEESCVHHHPSRALGDLTGIKKHFSRKHGEKKWKCDKCSKRYAVQSDWKAHSKICGTKEYRCDCGTLFSRKDSFVTHRAFCDALVEQNYREDHGLATMADALVSRANIDAMAGSSFSNVGVGAGADEPLRSLSLSSFTESSSGAGFSPNILRACSTGPGGHAIACFVSGNHHVTAGSACMSATALLQKAAEMGAKVSDDAISHILFRGFTGHDHLSGATPLVEASASSIPAAVTMDPESTFHPGRMVSSPMPPHPEQRRSPANFPPLQQSMQGTVAQEACGIKGRATQDFLGLGPVGGVIADGQSRRGGADGLGFPADVRPKEDGIHPSYHRLTTLEECHQTAMDRSVWNY